MHPFIAMVQGALLPASFMWNGKYSNVHDFLAGVAAGFFIHSSWAFLPRTRSFLWVAGVADMAESHLVAPPAPCCTSRAYQSSTASSIIPAIATDSSVAWPLGAATSALAFAPFIWRSHGLHDPS